MSAPPLGAYIALRLRLDDLHVQAGRELRHSRPRALCEEQIVEARALHRAGRSWRQIGVAFGVSPTTARRAVEGGRRGYE